MKGLMLFVLVALAFDMPWFSAETLGQEPAKSGEGSDIRKARLILELKHSHKFNETSDEDFKPKSGAFSPDGNYIAVGESTSGINDYSGPQIMIWEAKTGKLVHELRGRNLFKESGQIHVLSFSADSKHLLSSGIDGALRLWNVQTGKNDVTIKPPRTEFYYDAIFSPNGQLIAAVDRECAISVWDATTAKKLDGWTVPGKHFQDLTSLAFSHDGKTLVSSGQGGLYFWNVQDHRLIRQVPNPVNSHYPTSLGPIAFTNESKTLVGYSDYSDNEIDNEIIRFVADTGKLLGRSATGKSARQKMTFSQDGKTALSDTFENFDPTEFLAVWDLPSGKKRYRFKVSLKMPSCLALSPDGRTALVADDGGLILIYQLPP